MTTRIITGDCRAVLAAMPAESVHMVVTSPPYYGLRDYGIPPQIWGGDPDCRHRWGAQRLRNPKNPRVHCLHPPTGAFCAHCGAWRGSLGLEPTIELYLGHMVEICREIRRVLRKDGTFWLNIGDSYASNGPSGGDCGLPSGMKPKDLMLIPFRLAIRLQEDGWWVRRDHIWYKPNAMPESVRDRCTTAHEYLFLLTKSARYYYDGAAIKEPAVSEHASGNSFDAYYARISANSRLKGVTGPRQPWNDIGGKRNKHSVWTLATTPFPEAHFATFPPDLVEPCILAGCPPDGTVLDPFGGAGTVGLVADRLRRHAILIELNPEYAAMARRRIERDAGMFAQVAAE